MRKDGWEGMGEREEGKRERMKKAINGNEKTVGSEGLRKKGQEKFSGFTTRQRECFSKENSSKSVDVRHRHTHTPIGKRKPFPLDDCITKSLIEKTDTPLNRSRNRSSTQSHQQNLFLMDRPSCPRHFFPVANQPTDRPTDRQWALVWLQSLLPTDLTEN